MPDRVICRSDYDYIGRPQAFYWEDQRLEVVEVLSELHTPNGYTFRVRSQQNGIFELAYDQTADQWSVHQH